MTINNVALPRLFFILLSIFSVGIYLPGCSKDISRDEAKALIIEQLEYPITVTEKLFVGTDWPGNFMDVEWLKSMAKENLIRYAPGQISRQGKVILKDEIAPFIAPERGAAGLPGFQERYLTVKIANKEFIEVTGMRRSEDKKTVVVEYTFKYAPFSKDWKEPIAEAAGLDMNKLNEEQVTLRLYDDGWRVEGHKRKLSSNEVNIDEKIIGKWMPTHAVSTYFQFDPDHTFIIGRVNMTMDDYLKRKEGTWKVEGDVIAVLSPEGNYRVAFEGDEIVFMVEGQEVSRSIRVVEVE